MAADRLRLPSRPNSSWPFQRMWPLEFAGALGPIRWTCEFAIPSKTTPVLPRRPDPDAEEIGGEFTFSTLTLFFRVPIRCGHQKGRTPNLLSVDRERTVS